MQKDAWGKWHSGALRHGVKGHTVAVTEVWREDAQGKRRQHGESRGEKAEVAVMETGTTASCGRGLAEFLKVGK